MSAAPTVPEAPALAAKDSPPASTEAIPNAADVAAASEPKKTDAAAPAVTAAPAPDTAEPNMDAAAPAAAEVAARAAPAPAAPPVALAPPSHPSPPPLPASAAAHESLIPPPPPPPPQPPAAQKKGGGGGAAKKGPHKRAAKKKKERDAWGSSWDAYDPVARAEADAATYRNRYPGKQDNTSLTKNVEFYKNERRSDPGRMFVDDMHKHVSVGGRFGDHDWLETDHSFIQWLFPIREMGLNPRAQELQAFEGQLIARNEACRARLVRSYEMLLDLYGMRLADPATGRIARRVNGAGEEDFVEQYANLNCSSHNYLRITRILKCLGECGLERYKKPFVLHVIREMYTNGHLWNCESSCLDYWARTLRAQEDRDEVEATAAELAHRAAEAGAGAEADEAAADPYKGYYGFGGWGASYASYDDTLAFLTR
eukprot:Rhum_TRINITY_DN9440_c0_g1::Rhum_TRINITY_DN9440_c0_g1_i1::g.33530::m.33530